jgi:deazaflavin-dependent oxidoreductase (nitroreductase family)
MRSDGQGVPAGSGAHRRHATTGARSGREITTPIVAVPDGDGLVMVGSNFGQAKHPGWVHNLRADPRARIDGRDVRAEEVTGEERDRLFALATAVYPGYPAYVRRAAPRRIAVMRLR